MSAGGSTTTSSKRLLSLDVFRGITVVGMLLVNNIALDYATPRQLKHADWSGDVNIADLVFPWFLLIVGVALPFSWASFKRDKGTVRLWIGKALVRAFYLFVIGCVVDSVVARQVIIHMDVLQLIGCASFVGALGILMPPVARFILAALLLGGYATLLTRFPVPNEAFRFTEDGNVIKLLHDAILEPMGLKGILSIIPAGAMVLIGATFGTLLSNSKTTYIQRILGLLLGGGVLASIGYLWQSQIPLNKPLWTPSYILFTGGLGLLLMGALYTLVDLPAFQRFMRIFAYPFEVFGSNAIVAYAAQIIVRETVLQNVHWTRNVTLDQAYRHYLFAEFGHWHGGWLYTVSYIIAWWFVLLFLHLRRMYIRL